MLLLLLSYYFVGLVEPNMEEDEGSRLPRTKVIHTKYGQVQGRLAALEGSNQRLQSVKVFKGIPYATPPVGSNR